jgi:hypothetical protein
VPEHRGSQGQGITEDSRPPVGVSGGQQIDVRLGEDPFDELTLQGGATVDVRVQGVGQDAEAGRDRPHRQCARPAFVDHVERGVDDLVEGETPLGPAPAGRRGGGHRPSA